MTEYWGGGTRHFFLLTLYNFKNMGGAGGRGHVHPLPPYSAVPVFLTKLASQICLLCCRCVPLSSVFEYQLSVDIELSEV